MALFQLHGLVPAGTPHQGTAPEHEILPCGPVNAVISRLSHDASVEAHSPEALAALAMTHNNILLAYCAETTVVPMAIGSMFSGRSAILSELNAQMDQHVITLNALRDIQEFTIHLKITGTPTLPKTQPTSGRHFLRLQQKQRHGRDNLRAERQKLAQDVLSQVQLHTDQIHPSSAQKPDEVMNCTVLLERSNITHLRNLARHFHEPALHLGMDFVITGPWPPYSSDILSGPKGKVKDAISA